MNGLRKFSLKNFFIRALLAVILIAVTQNTTAQRTSPKEFDSLLTKPADTIKPRLTPQPTPPLTVTASDTIPGKDSLTVQKIDTFSLKLSKDTLEAPIQYTAEDSVVVMIKSKKILLYGKTKTEYQDVVLTAPIVGVDQQTQVLTAYNKKDSTGAVIEDAVSGRVKMNLQVIRLLIILNRKKD
jgi:hypothetical protein